jgi:hypothetical protein
MSSNSTSLVKSGTSRGGGRIRFTIEKAYGDFGFNRSYLKKPVLFFFGSDDSLLSAKEDLFEWLENTPFSTYINIGLESADMATLRMLRKPLSPDRVRGVYGRMLDILRKGSLYLSPLINGTKATRDEERKLLGEFDKFRLGSRLPTYLYLIQRL